MEPPKVTGLAPNAGPPGTKLTIRGENLGTGIKDLIGLTICGKDCLMSAEWKSPAKIICRSGSGIGKGDVIVTTYSGGVGTCTVQFRGFMETIGPVKGSAVWVDESILVNPVFARKRAASPSQLHPDDPLELSDELNEEKFPEEELVEMFPDGCGDLRAENFVATWFLLENHNGTSFDDLKSGLNCLRRKVSQHKEGPLSFFKANVLPVMDCLETLLSLKNNIDSYQHQTSDEMIKKLEAAIVKSKDGANSLFEEVLKRKDHADTKRNALNVMQRFKFLFHLPCNIERNINKGDYGIVINDYARAKSLFANTEVQVFKKVYEEVEEKIRGLRQMLAEKLKVLPNSLDEVKKTIKCLVDLEAPGDPAWESITYHYDWVGGLLKKCRDSYLEQVQLEENEDAGLQSRRSGRKDSYHIKDDVIGIKHPLRIKFVTRVNDLFCDSFPALWKLGQAYFGGELGHKDTGDSSGRVDPVKQAAYRKMVLESFRFHCSLVRAALLPHTLSSLPLSEIKDFGIWPEKTLESVGAWIPQCLRCVRTSYTSMIRLSLPGDALDIMQELIFDLRVHSMVTLFNQVIEDVSNIHQREVWVLEIDDENGAITQLPLLFENMIVEKLQLIKESVLHTGMREQEIFVSTKVQTMIKQMTHNLLTAFTSSLDKLAFQCDDKETMFASTVASPKIQSESKKENTTLEWERKLLVILNNCKYVVNHILPLLKTTFTKNGYPDISSVIKGSVSSYNALDQKVFEAYVEQKSGPIIGVIEQNMYVGKFDWNQCSKPTGVRSYIKQVIMEIISVHSEVYSVSPMFIKRVMIRIVELVAEEIARLYTCIPSFSDSGTQQARLDIIALQDVLLRNQTTVSTNFFKECISCLPLSTDSQDRELLDKLLKEFQQHMQFQLLCFQSNLIVPVG